MPAYVQLCLYVVWKCDEPCQPENALWHEVVDEQLLSKTIHRFVSKMQPGCRQAERVDDSADILALLFMERRINKQVAISWSPSLAS